MDDENALPETVITLFRQLGTVLVDARSRLDALVLLADVAVPPQQQPQHEGPARCTPTVTTT